MQNKIEKVGKRAAFRLLHRGQPFIKKTTLYTKSNGEEDEKEHIFFKSSKQSAKAGSTHVMKHFLPDDLVELCSMH